MSGKCMRLHIDKLSSGGNIQRICHAKFAEVFAFLMVFLKSSKNVPS